MQIGKFRLGIEEIWKGIQCKFTRTDVFLHTKTQFYTCTHFCAHGRTNRFTFSNTLGSEDYPERIADSSGSDWRKLSHVFLSDVIS